MASWCEALGGSLPIEAALAILVKGLGAEAGMLVRAQASGVIKVAVHDRLARTVIRPLRNSYAEEQFGQNLARSRCGAVWLGSTDREPDDQRETGLGDFQRSRHFGEFAVIVLTGAAKNGDWIELHYRDVPQAADQRMLSTLGPTIARTWANRQVGLISGAVLSSRGMQTSPHGAQPILGATNPAHLSRAEFRVCLLLARGLSVAGIVADLGLAEATVRTHLRSIYAKTETSGLTQLVFQLIAMGRGFEPAEKRA
jgi:DNA-binding CsgD family transcriptional regulator